MSLLGVTLQAGMPMESIRANIKLAISGGQNEPRDAIAGTVWALLTHPDQLELVRSGKISWLQAFEEYARWISPIGMSPRRIAKPWKIRDVEFEPEERVFLMFGSANRDEKHFANAEALMCAASQQEHRVRRRPAFLRRRLGFARHGRRRRAAGDLFAAEKFAAGGAAADRRLGVPRPARSAGDVGRLAPQHQREPDRNRRLLDHIEHRRAGARCA